ncbi:zinc-ribbon domain-containing protein [Roseovarius sp. ZX-A-9]|uniref:zinc-ribbon domain-containing protein n=1 Tax=Roseovarius sp. ZX-A-9 TaxID=3014783 RepID=UPI00232C266D|nr:zinc-ribbon domain-containing protein [Roseovarius sp. ZX-A-9]
MRLTCPNCGAQYEIPDDVLPESGRDVQCSNCGDTWYQHHPNHPVEDDEANDRFAVEVGYDADRKKAEQTADDTAPDSTDTDATDTDAQDADAEDAEGADTEGADTPATDTEGKDIDPASEAPQRRRLDPEVANVLREEAEREAQVRARESGSLESQPDLGLDTGDEGSDRRSREARERMARLRGQPETEATPDIDPSSRRGLLPDIEEINSSLRSSDEEAESSAAEDMYPVAPGENTGGGFRRGFILIIAIAAVLTLLYVFAPQISRAVPALADVMGEYVQGVNSGRAWLDDQIAALMRWLDGMASSAPDGDAS